MQTERSVEKTTQRGALCSVLPTEYSGDHIKKNEMGGACATYGGQKRCILGFGGGDLMERDHLEDQGIDSRIILKRIFKTLNGEAWNGLLWLRIGTVGGRLWMP
jgi:hypothetical protein